MNRAGVCRSGVDRPVFRDQFLSLGSVEQFHIGVEIALEIRDGGKITFMLDTADIEIIIFLIEDIPERVYRGDLRGLLDQADKEAVLHDIGIHEDVRVVCFAFVFLYGLYALLSVQAESIAGAVSRFGAGDLVIQQRDISAGCDMVIQQFPEILLEHHVSRRKDDILRMHSADDVEVDSVRGNIRIVDFVDPAVLVEKELEFAAFGVDIVNTACSEMFSKGARVLADVDLNAVNIAVAQIGMYLMPVSVQNWVYKKFLRK